MPANLIRYVGRGWDRVSYERGGGSIRIRAQVRFGRNPSNLSDPENLIILHNICNI